MSPRGQRQKKQRYYQSVASESKEKRTLGLFLLRLHLKRRSHFVHRLQSGTVLFLHFLSFVLKKFEVQAQALVKRKYLR